MPDGSPKDREPLLRSILDSSLDGIMALRAFRSETGAIEDFEWILVNARAAEVFERPAESLNGHRLLVELPVYRLDGLFDRLVRVVETGEPLDVEHFFERDRNRRWLHSVAVKLGDGVAITFADVSDRKRLEEQVLQAQKMEILGRLVGGIAHDFNNLLTAISMNAELALDQLDPESPGHSEVESVIDGVRRATGVAQQLLAFARRQTVATRVVRVGDVITHIAPMLRHLLGNNIEMKVKSDADAWTVSLDPIKLEQVLTNLAVNAHDAMPNGGKFGIEVSNATVRVGDAATLRRVSPGEYVRIEAQDTGPGIPEETIGHIFEAFFTTKGGRGTGLGLATSYGIIRQAGGMIWVTSTQGRGASFTIMLPRATTDAESWPATPPKLRTSSGSERILIVDDEPAVRTVVARTLGRLGYATVAAGHGEEALRMLSDEPASFDLVLSDIVMPRMNGRELRKATQEKFPALPFLLMSGFEADGPNRADPVLKKPFSANELATAVREALDAKK
ncbi:MAG TPA: ATP-binding protein [Gemmatimonadaceae bacterium]|nr:ATP-binding protein [Gemmatimonadaceae bacterium]